MLLIFELTDGVFPQNINYGIKVQTLKAFLDANAIKYNYSNTNGKLDNIKIAQKVSNSTILLGCLNTRKIKQEYY